MPEALEADARAAPGQRSISTRRRRASPGGTGTYVFLVGLGAWTGATLTVTQYFLGDLDGEPALLHAVAQAVAEAGQLVTFNGRTFDLPLLETRYLLARAGWWGLGSGAPGPLPGRAGPLAGRAADCRLTTLEGALLGLDRGDDLPGALVPQVYFRYLRTRDPGALPRVFAHNRWDLVALAGLHARAAALLGGPDPRHDPAEWVGARTLARAPGAGSERARSTRPRFRAGLPAALGARAWPGGSGGSGGARGASPRRARSGRRPWPGRSARRSASWWISRSSRSTTRATSEPRSTRRGPRSRPRRPGRSTAARELVEALERRARRLTRRLARAVAPAPRGRGRRRADPGRIPARRAPAGASASPRRPAGTPRRGAGSPRCGPASRRDTRSPTAAPSGRGPRRSAAGGRGGRRRGTGGPVTTTSPSGCGMKSMSSGRIMMSTAWPGASPGGRASVPSSETIPSSVTIDRRKSAAPTNSATNRVPGRW